MNTIPKNEVTVVSEKLGRVFGLMQKDMEVMSDAELAATHGGKSRCGFDLVYEIVGALDNFTNQLKGVEPKDRYSEGWPAAPESFKSKEHAQRALAEAAENFVNALASYEGDLNEACFKGPGGSLSAIGLTELARGHTLYHSGQLNYIQTINGDADFHWF